MGFVVLSVLAQVLTVVHIIRTGRNQLWIMAAVFLSIPGCIAYFIVEVGPEIWGGRAAQGARTKAIKAIDPERELRAARDALDLTDTPATHRRVGDALCELGRPAEAVPHLEAALTGVQAGDPRTIYRLANALLAAGNAARALAAIEPLPVDGSSDGDRAGVLRARILEALGRAPEAMTLYADLVSRVPGEEVRCRYANLLIEAGRADEARVLLTEVAARARRLTRQQRAADKPMYDWAADQLRQLQA
ncbi:tetratricopeptide repeat protein [Glacieibacterium frigidum]|uniref:Tetratricopeptide repeat protein n=1 Tax=Glacieibacterium frigidum TaxID=2593303 RepID=A0A552UGS2_9SPHN|nr:tetratricopeptide repeat protein [Glacieibacterium frigidum]TRW17406.1 tetratricopeptide repeat protein [Glacieibacterium frigidum]